MCPSYSDTDKAFSQWIQTSCCTSCCSSLVDPERYLPRNYMKHFQGKQLQAVMIPFIPVLFVFLSSKFCSFFCHPSFVLFCHPSFVLFSVMKVLFVFLPSKVFFCHPSFGFLPVIQVLFFSAMQVLLLFFVIQVLFFSCHPSFVFFLSSKFCCCWFFFLGGGGGCHPSLVGFFLCHPIFFFLTSKFCSFFCDPSIVRFSAI